MLGDRSTWGTWSTIVFFMLVQSIRRATRDRAEHRCIGVDNAILLVDQAGRLTAAGAGVREAVAEAGRRRLRPILTTTPTTRSP